MPLNHRWPICTAKGCNITVYHKKVLDYFFCNNNRNFYYIFIFLLHFTFSFLVLHFLDFTTCEVLVPLYVQTNWSTCGEWGISCFILRGCDNCCHVLLLIYGKEELAVIWKKKTCFVFLAVIKALGKFVTLSKWW